MQDYDVVFIIILHLLLPGNVLPDKAVYKFRRGMCRDKLFGILWIFQDTHDPIVKFHKFLAAFLVDCDHHNDMYHVLVPWNTFFTGKNTDHCPAGVHME